MRTRLISIRLATIISLCLTLPMAVPLSAPASDRGNDVRVAGVCGKGAAAKLRLKGKDGTIGVEFEVGHRHRGERWTIVLVHEHRVVWRGSARTKSGGSAFRIRRSIPDLPGADRVTVRAAGPRGVTCEAAALLSA